MPLLQETAKSIILKKFSGVFSSKQPVLSHQVSFAAKVSSIATKSASKPDVDPLRRIQYLEGAVAKLQLDLLSLKALLSSVSASSSVEFVVPRVLVSTPSRKRSSSSLVSSLPKKTNISISPASIKIATQEAALSSAVKSSEASSSKKVQADLAPMDLCDVDTMDLSQAEVSILMMLQRRSNRALGTFQVTLFLLKMPNPLIC